VIRRSFWLVAATGAAVAPLGVAAQVRTVPALTVAGGVGYDSNPFLGAGGAKGSASTTLNVMPSITFVDGVDRAVIAGSYNRQDFFTRYGSNNGYQASANGHKQFDARTGIDVAASYDSSVLGGAGNFAPIGQVVPVTGGAAGSGIGSGASGSGSLPVVSAPIGTAPVVTIPVDGDIGLIGLRQRRKTLSTSASASYLLSERTSLFGGVNASRSTYPGAQRQSILLGNFTQYGANAGFSRSIDELSSVGVQLSASFVDYDRGFSSSFFTPRLTYNRTLSPRWTLNAAVGGAIVHDRISGTSVTVSAEGTLCRTFSERGNFCAFASREPSVTGFGGVRTQTTAGATLGYRLSEVSTVSASARYNHVANGTPALSEGVLPANQDFTSVDGSYQRQLGRHLSALASAGYRHISSGFRTAGGSTGGNSVFGRLGLTLSLGGQR